MGTYMLALLCSKSATLDANTVTVQLYTHAFLMHDGMLKDNLHANSV